MAADEWNEAAIEREAVAKSHATVRQSDPDSGFATSAPPFAASFHSSAATDKPSYHLIDRSSASISAWSASGLVVGA